MKLFKFYLSTKYRGFYFTISLLLDVILRNIFFRFIPLVIYTRIKNILKLGYIVDFKHPNSFNEKILYKKFYTNITNLSPYADKYKVRTILKNKNYNKYINDLFLVIEDPEQINYDKLPKSFVMKANHGSGMIKIVKDKSEINVNSIKELASKWLKTNYNKSISGTEFHYDAIKPKIIFEKLLENKDGSSLLDYKFFCLHGKVEFVDIIDNSRGIPLTYIYDKNWNQLPFALFNKPIKSSFQKPANFEEMIQVAENLSAEFDFVRIDLYIIDNQKVIFGEYTFFPGGGMLRFVPRKYDYLYGEKFKIKIR